MPIWSTRVDTLLGASLGVIFCYLFYLVWRIKHDRKEKDNKSNQYSFDRIFQIKSDEIVYYASKGGHKTKLYNNHIEEVRQVLMEINKSIGSENIKKKDEVRIKGCIRRLFEMQYSAPTYTNTKVLKPNAI